MVERTVAPVSSGPWFSLQKCVWVFDAFESHADLLNGKCSFMCEAISGYDCKAGGGGLFDFFSQRSCEQGHSNLACWQSPVTFTLSCHLWWPPLNFLAIVAVEQWKWKLHKLGNCFQWSYVQGDKWYVSYFFRDLHVGIFSNAFYISFGIFETE